MAYVPRTCRADEANRLGSRHTSGVKLAAMLCRSKKRISVFCVNLERYLIAAKNDNRGVAAIEFAVIMPVLIILMVASFDLGTGFYRKMQVQNSAQAGAVYAMLHGFSSSSITSAVTSATSFSGIS